MKKKCYLCNIQDSRCVCGVEDKKGWSRSTLMKISRLRHNSDITGVMLNRGVVNDHSPIILMSVRVKPRLLYDIWKQPDRVYTEVSLLKMLIVFLRHPTASPFEAALSEESVAQVFRVD